MQTTVIPQDFISVTERGGEPVSSAQLARFHQRYLWAGSYCRGRDVLEMACGTGPGLGHLRHVARSLVAGDLDPVVLSHARRHYGDRVELREFDAAAAPFANQSFDVVILFEAIYYVPDVDRLVGEVARLLRTGGTFLIATANKDLFDFNPSPYATAYLNPPELSALLRRHAMSASFFGGSPVGEEDWKSRAVRRLKKAAVTLRLIPKSMRGKRLLKRLFFGPLVRMPEELNAERLSYEAPVPISSDRPDTRHLVLYCAATKL